MQDYLRTDYVRKTYKRVCVLSSTSAVRLTLCEFNFLDFRGIILGNNLTILSKMYQLFYCRCYFILFEMNQPIFQKGRSFNIDSY